MSSTDASIINTRERPLSTDVMNVQNVLGRTILDVLKFSGASVDFPVSPGAPGWAPRNCVLNGLVAQPGQTDAVTISAGALVQNSATLSPPVGTLDSTYRIGINRDVSLIPFPSSPGSPIYELIEARMAEIVANSQSRDRFDIGTEQFQAVSLTKLTERVVEFQVTTSASETIPAFTGGDWVPIAAVRRTAPNTLIAAADIIDLRPMWTSAAAHGNEVVPQASTSGVGPRRGAPGSFVVAASGAITLDAEAFTTEGERVWFSGAVDPTTMLEPSVSYIADTWYYVYLAPFRGIAPASPQGAAGRGVLVISPTSPNRLGLNASPLTLPVPFDDLSAVAASDAVCVAALRRNAGNTGFVPCWSSDGREFRLAVSASPVVVITAITAPGTNAVVVPAGSFPACAQDVLLHAAFSMAGSAAATVNNIRIYAPGDTTNSFIPTWSVADDALTSGVYTTDFDLPVRYMGGNNFDVVVSGGFSSFDPSTGLGFYLLGWRM